MGVSVDASYLSLNKYQEELCGDKVEILKTDQATTIILADGMGSGVKANILSTLTSKILGTMFLNGATTEDMVETIIKTLPVCQVRKVAYSTFSILQISYDGQAYLVEFDNPPCVVIRDGKQLFLPSEEKVIEGKKIKESRFAVKPGDSLILMSDGAIHAGVGMTLNYGWTWECVSEYAVEASRKTISASRLAAVMSKACEDLYMQMPGDDTTFAVARVMDQRQVYLLTGPPLHKEEDAAMVREFMEGQAVRIVSGGTSANIVARQLHKTVEATLDYVDPDIPPIARIPGVDLVTEGVITLSRALSLLKKYGDGNVDEEFFEELDKKNGGSMIAKVLIEACTDLTMFVGRAINEAHQNPSLPFDLSIRMNLVEQIRETAEKMGKNVKVKYF